MKTYIAVSATLVTAGLLAVVVVTAAQNPPAAQAPAAPAQPMITLGPGLREVPDYRKVALDAPVPSIPAGYASLFNGRDLTGWHVSKTARHGVNPDFHVSQGMILGTQRPLGSGGLLISDKKYKNFDFTMDVKPDFGNDSGFFFRTTETGAAYQITLDYLPGGSMGRLISEGGITFGAGRGAGAAAGGGGAGRGAAPAAATPAQAAPAAAGAGRGTQSNDAGMKLWKRDDWNTVRVRVEGVVPHATVWINGEQVSDATDTENHAVDGMVEGPIAIQIHGGGVRWQPGGFWRWRNLAIKDLP